MAPRKKPIITLTLGAGGIMVKTGLAQVYQVTSDWGSILEELAVLEGELTPELEEKLDALVNTTEEAVDRVCDTVRYLQLLSVAAQKEAERLTERAISFNNHSEIIKERLRNCLEMMDKSQVKTARYTAYISKGRESVELADASKIPAKFLIPQDPKLDKAGIGKALKAGEEVEGATLVIGTPSLVIR